MVIYQVIRVLSLFVFIALLVLALLRPRTKQGLIVTGLVLSILATIPTLPGLSTRIISALWTYNPQNDHTGYYVYLDLLNLVDVLGAALFGWAALTSRPRAASAGPMGGQPSWQGAPQGPAWHGAPQVGPWQGQPQQSWQQGQPDPGQYDGGQYQGGQYDGGQGGQSGQWTNGSSQQWGNQNWQQRP